MSNVIYMFESPKADYASRRHLMIEILRDAELPDPEGSVYRAVQYFITLGAAERHIERLIAWKEEGTPDAEARFWKTLEEARKG